MVRLRHVLGLLGCILAMATPAEATKPMVKATIHPASQLKSGKLEGTLSVFHAPDQTIDINQVLIDDQPLKVDLVVESKVTAEERREYPNYAPEDIVTILRFELEGKPKGLYILPTISIPIAGERISTIPSTYDIQPEQAVASLRMETIMDPSGPFYPGQRARFGYRIYFDQPTELSAETLPLLTPEGFEKIGQEEIRETPSSLFNVQEIIQEVRAQNPGSYSVPASQIEGRNFREDATGQRLPLGPVLHAETPPSLIEVHPFPQEGRPASFTGTVGNVALEVHLLSSNAVLVGDELRVSVRMTHEGDLDQLTLPDLACQPGFSGFFRLNDFPPNEQTNTESKEFILTLRPMSTLITAIPAIEIAYFDPQSRSYQTALSTKIPITVTSAQIPLAQPNQPTSPQATPTSRPVIRTSPSQSSLKHETVTPALTAMDLVSPSVDTRLIGTFMAVGAALIGFQWWIRERWRHLPTDRKRLTSTDLMIQASKHQHHLGILFEQLERALLKRLKENGHCPPNIRFASQLPDNDPCRRVKSFVLSLQQSLYGGGKALSAKETLEMAREIYTQINRGFTQ